MLYRDFLGGPLIRNPPAKCGGHRFDPLSRKILWQLKTHAPQLLSPHSRTREPQLVKPLCSSASVPQHEKPLQRELRASQLESSPHLLKREKSLHGNGEPTQPKINKIIKKK